MEEVWRKLSVQ